MPTDEPDATPAAEPEAVDYKKQYEIALRAGEKATRSHEAAIAQFNAEKQAHETAKATMESMKAEMKTLANTLGQKDIELSSLQEEITQLEPVKVKAMRLEIIMSDFPQLAPFEKDGLLPAGETPEALRGSLAKFAERLAAHSKMTDASFVSGGKPENVPAPEHKKSSADLAKDYLDSAIQAQRSGNMAEYELNYTKFLQEKNKQQA